MNFLPPIDHRYAVEKCIRKNNHVWITKKQDNWKKYKTTLTDTSFDGITIGNYDQEDDTSIEGEVGVSFRAGHNSLVFKTICKNDVLTWPKNIIKIPRHNYTRFRPHDSVITVKFWPPDNLSQTQYGQIENVSAGGMKISAKNRGVQEGSFYCCSIDYKNGISVNAILRSIETAENSDRIELCFQFIGLELDYTTTAKIINFTTKVRRGQRHHRRRPQATD